MAKKIYLIIGVIVDVCLLGCYLNDRMDITYEKIMAQRTNTVFTIIINIISNAILWPIVVISNVIRILSR